MLTSGSRKRDLFITYMTHLIGVRDRVAIDCNSIIERKSIADFLQTIGVRISKCLSQSRGKAHGCESRVRLQFNYWQIVPFKKATLTGCSIEASADVVPNAGVGHLASLVCGCRWFGCLKNGIGRFVDVAAGEHKSVLS